MSKSKDIRVQDSKEWIIKALDSLIQTKEYEDILVRDIIEKSGVSKSTFHRHFSGKDSVLENLIHYNYSLICKNILDISDSIIHPENTKIYISEALKTIGDKPELFLLLSRINRREILLNVIITRMRINIKNIDTTEINLEELEYKVLAFISAFISTAFIYINKGKGNYNEVAEYLSDIFTKELNTKTEQLVPYFIITTEVE